MSADISPHVYKPLPTAHCAECLGTRRNDFCQDEGVTLAHRHVTATGPGLYASHSRSMCGPECDERAVR
jgi:hypothetical protein